MKKSNKFKSFAFYIIPIFLWMGIIFYFSSMRGNGFEGNPDFWFYAERKGAHFFEYLMLTLLIARPILKVKSFKKKFLRTIILIGEFSLLYAVSDEIHQKFVYGREGKLLDIGIDLVGIVIAIFIIYKFRENKIIKRFLA